MRACHYPPLATLFTLHRDKRTCTKELWPLLCAGALLALSLCFLFPFTARANASWSVDDKPYSLGEKTYFHLPPDDSFVQNGLASWYGPSFHGRRTSNGERFDMHSLTAAHKTLPMDTVVLVKNLENGKQTVVRINDRGPYLGGRILDLSHKAAYTLGLKQQGTAKVQIVALAEGEVDENSQVTRLFRRNLEEGEFFVQIGSFTQHNNALRLQKRFNDAGHNAQLHQAARDNSLLYRVHVYVGKTLQAAKVAEKSLLQSGYRGAFVIAR
jgi:rare lipoprotein A